MGQSAPKPPDYLDASLKTAEASKANTTEQTQANRPNQQNAFGSTTQWSQDANGNWVQSQNFGGQFGGLANNLQGQASANMSTPFSFGQFGQLGTGDDARNQAIEAAYGQATSRLNPQWEQRDTQLRSQLANQGLAPDSEAARNATAQFNQSRNDAYGSAMNSAIMQGQQAGDSVFRNNMLSRQQAISEALRQRGMPMQELAAMQGFLGQPGFERAGMAQAPDLLNSAIATGNYRMGAWNAENQANADAWGGGMQLLSALGPLAFSLSDERAKTRVERLGIDALPGVPFATWEWKEGFGPAGRELGVIAQDLERVAPEMVATRGDGLKLVNYAALLEAINE